MSSYALSRFVIQARGQVREMWRATSRHDAATPPSGNIVAANSEHILKGY
jgi:hypothetical protein